MKTKEVSKFGVTVVISYDPLKTTPEDLEALVRDAQVTCTRIRNKRGY